jgi:hypothetical protein
LLRKIRIKANESHSMIRRKKDERRTFDKVNAWGEQTLMSGTAAHYKAQQKNKETEKETQAHR